MDPYKTWAMCEFLSSQSVWSTLIVIIIKLYRHVPKRSSYQLVFYAMVSLTFNKDVMSGGTHPSGRR